MLKYSTVICNWDTSSEIWIDKLSITLWKSGIWVYKKNRNNEKITFKLVQIKFLAMHITNQKLRFEIFTIGNVQSIFMERDLFFRKIYHFDPYNVLLAIAI